MPQADLQPSLFAPTPSPKEAASRESESEPPPENADPATNLMAPPPVTQADPCPACEETDVRVLFHATDLLYHTTDQVFRVVECRRCNLIRLDPQPSPLELRHYYPPTYWFHGEEPSGGKLSLQERYRRFVLRDHLHFIEQAVNSSGAKGTVLDVGCGGGLILQMLEDRDRIRKAGPFAGLDFSLDAAYVAWHKHQVPVTCATLTRAPFKPGSCAAVTMFHVLEHLYDPGAYLDAAHELLAPEGRLIVQVPNAACWQFLLLGDRWNGIDVPRHLIDFRASDLDALLDACGFEPVRHKHFSLRDNPAGLATSLAPSLDPMSRRLRQVPETDRQRLWKDLLYAGLVAASVPFTLLEAACRAGSTIMVEARKKGSRG